MENEIKNDARTTEKRGRVHDKGQRVQTARMKKSLTRYGIGLLVVVLGVSMFVFSRTGGSSGAGGEDFSIGYGVQGRNHIANGAPHPAYNSNPPSSGSHYASPARGGFYEEVLPDEQVVHNLEHGDIWIAYRPDITDDVKATLRSFAGPYVVVSPRSENEADISLVAWGRVDSFSLENGAVDKERIRGFIRRYDNRGPERIRAASAGHGAL